MAKETVGFESSQDLPFGRDLPRGEEAAPGRRGLPCPVVRRRWGRALLRARRPGIEAPRRRRKRLPRHVMSYGPLLLGHAPGRIIQAVRAASRLGTSFGAPTELEVMLARRVCRAMPSIEGFRFVSSGTEAAMSAIRVARGFTKRDLIVKTDGGYHGHADSFLVAAGSAAATLGIAGSPGVPQALAEKTLVVPYNDIDALGAAFRKHGEQIAAFIVEPVAANMGVVSPAPGYLEAAREIVDGEARLAPDLRRGDHGISARARAAPRKSTESSPT